MAISSPLRWRQESRLAMTYLQLTRACIFQAVSSKIRPSGWTRMHAIGRAPGRSATQDSASCTDYSGLSEARDAHCSANLPPAMRFSQGDSAALRPPLRSFRTERACEGQSRVCTSICFGGVAKAGNGRYADVIIDTQRAE